MSSTVPRKRRATCHEDQGMGNSHSNQRSDMIPSQRQRTGDCGRIPKSRTSQRKAQTPTTPQVHPPTSSTTHHHHGEGRITIVKKPTDRQVSHNHNSSTSTRFPQQEAQSPDRVHGFEDELQRLERLKTEVETCTVKHIRTGRHEVRHVPTYRAVLASRGYLVKEKLGKGSYSQVRLAKSYSGVIGDVAVKIVDRQLAPRDFKDKFLPREIRIWPTIQHQNIIRVIRQFQDGRRVYFIMEYASGGDALHYIQQHGALHETVARNWMRQLTDAVNYLHARRITHRDLKLENILLHADKVKICDFGFAKNCDEKLSDTFCGSKSYASPEILSGLIYDPMKADIWALGVILFILVTGKMPFDEKKGNTGILCDQRAMALYWPPHGSASCRTMIMNILVYDYRRRPNIRDVMAYSWMVHERMECSTSGTGPSASKKYNVLPPVKHAKRHTTHTSTTATPQPSQSV